MKKLILMLLLVTTVVFAGFDESEFDESQFHSGVKVGLTYSGIAGDDVDDDDDNLTYKLGFEIGAFMLYRINELITFQPEILFTQKGYSMESNGEYLNISLNYIQVPLLFAFKTAPGLKLYAGGYLSTLISIGIDSSFMSSSEESDSGDKMEDDTNSTDIGAIVGVMFRGNQNMLFDIRYERGFSGLPKDANNNDQIFNQTFKFSFGWLF